MDEADAGPLAAGRGRIIARADAHPDAAANALSYPATFSRSAALRPTVRLIRTQPFSAIHSISIRQFREQTLYRHQGEQR